MKTDWNPVLRGEFAKPYWAELQQFVAAEPGASCTCRPTRCSPRRTSRPTPRSRW